MIGAKLGPYEVTARLGEGGMGEVWRATDSKLRREVAIKVLPAAFTQDADRLARFEREAQLLAQLNHPNIAQIYGLEASGEAHALVMELVEGPTLADRLAQGPLPLEESLALARQIAEALEAAHEKGIVHRDLKPQNIKVRADGAVKVLDFGLAKAVEPTEPQARPGVGPALANSPTLTGAGTRLGVILGTAAYMAPEQARGGAVDKRADIWAFGVVLHEMLSGRRLFDGETVSDVLAAVLRAEIDLGALPPASTAELRRLLRRCLERNPRNRLHDIADARIAIDEMLSGAGTAASAEPGRTTPTPALWRRALPLAGAVLAGAALAAAFLPRPASGPSPIAEAAAMRTLVADGISSDPSVSQDGRTLAFESERDGESRVWIKDLVSGSESVLVTRDSGAPDLSPDGTSALFHVLRPGDARVASDGPQRPGVEIYRISLATREERFVARNGEQSTWAPDGRSVLFLRDHGGSTNGFGELVTIDLTGGEERVLHRDAGKRMNDPRWSPQGRRILVTLNGFQSGLDDRIGLLDPAGGKLDEFPLELAGLHGVKVRGINWLSERRLAILLHDGGEIVSSAGRIALFDLETRALRSLLPLANVGFGIDRAGPESLIVGLGSTDQSLHESKRGADGRWTDPVPLTSGPVRDRQPAYSPDGRWLLFSSARSGNLDVWRLDRSSGERRRLTDHPAEDWDPALSPDGTKLLFSSNRSGRFQIWIAESDGSSPRQVTEVENAQNPTMSPDGEWIHFVRQDAGAGQNGLWRIHPDGSALSLVAAGNILVPETSPDGRYVVMRSDSARRIVRVADGELLPTELAQTDRYRWSVEGGRTYLWAVCFTAEGREVRRWPFDPESGVLGPAERILDRAAAGTVETLGVARDGSAVTFASLANRRGQLVRIDGLTGLAE